MISVLDLFTVGIGPSSSHTVGPMRAARLFVERMATNRVLDRAARIRVTLHGSLAMTGKGHGTDKAILLGLEGHSPEAVPVEEIEGILDRVRSTGRLVVEAAGGHEIVFDEGTDLCLNPTELLPRHSNGMRFEAFDSRKTVLLTRDYYSVGGGFVVDDEADLDPSSTV